MRKIRTGLAPGAAILATAALLGGAVRAAEEEWRTLEAGSIRILYRDGNRSEALRLAAAGPRVMTRLEDDLGLPAPAGLTVRILPVVPGPGEGSTAPHWAVGYVSGGSATVVLRGDLVRSYPFQDLLGLFAHEVVHVLLGTLPPGSGEVPRWFHEGLAVAGSKRWSYRDAIALGTTVLVRSPASLESLSRTFPEAAPEARAAYAQAFSFVSFLERETPGSVRGILRRMRGGVPFEPAFRDAVGFSLAAAEAKWRSRVNFAYRWIPAITSSGVLWIGITVLVLVSRLARRRRDRALQESWEREGLG
jgi:hypothetical protein